MSEGYSLPDVDNFVVAGRGEGLVLVEDGAVFEEGVGDGEHFNAGLEDDLFERMVEERLDALSQMAPLDPSGRDDANEGAAPQPATLPPDENTDVPT